MGAIVSQIEDKIRWDREKTILERRDSGSRLISQVLEEDKEQFDNVANVNSPGSRSGGEKTQSKKYQATTSLEYILPSTPRNKQRNTPFFRPHSPC